MKSLRYYLILTLFLVPFSLHAQQIESMNASDAGFFDEFGISVGVSGTTTIIGAENAEAAYIFEQNDTGGWDEIAILTAIDEGTFNDFGEAVAIEGNMAAVGASGRATDQVGTVHFYSTIEGNWAGFQQVVASDGHLVDSFGQSVAMQNGTAIIGAPDHNDEGAAYIFEQDSDGNWQEIQKLTSPSTAESDDFGISVAIHQNHVIIGAEKADDQGSSSGVAYIFEKENGTWNEKKRLVPSSGGSFAFFGSAVAIEGNYAAVAANGTRNGNGQDGRVFFFERQNDAWTEVLDVESAGGGDQELFGSSLAIQDDVVMIGEERDSDGSEEGGSVYAYKRMNGTWQLETTYQSGDPDSGNEFGASIALDGSTLIVGATGAGPAGTAYAIDASNVATSVEELAYLQGTLYQNYPNPFQSSTTISFQLEKNQYVVLRVFDVLGRERATLADHTMAMGLHELNWNSQGLAPGLYVYQLQLGEAVVSRKMLKLE